MLLHFLHVYNVMLAVKRWMKEDFVCRQEYIEKCILYRNNDNNDTWHECVTWQLAAILLLFKSCYIYQIKCISPHRQYHLHTLDGPKRSPFVKWKHLGREDIDPPNLCLFFDDGNFWHIIICLLWLDSINLYMSSHINQLVPKKLYGSTYIYDFSHVSV